jgi:hypothetical protein
MYSQFIDELLLLLFQLQTERNTTIAALKTQLADGDASQLEPEKSMQLYH